MIQPNKYLFKDSIYITLLDNSPENSILGYTSKSGTFETTDSLSFPNILTLPPIVETNATGPAPIGVFSFSQSIVITLIDTVTSRSVSYVRQVIKGQNVFNLTWNPSSGSTSTNPSVSMERLERMNPFSADTIILPPPRWELTQNFPNPVGWFY